VSSNTVKKWARLGYLHDSYRNDGMCESPVVGSTESPGLEHPDMLARVQIRYPEIAIVFLETRPLAE
jgi:hypothetical protein